MKKILIAIVLVAACLAQGHAAGARFPKPILSIFSRVGLSESDQKVLWEYAQADDSVGDFAAIILYKKRPDEYRDLFRRRFGYDEALPLNIISEGDLRSKFRELEAEVGSLSKIEQDFFLFHYFRKNRYAIKRPDGADYIFEKMLRGAVFSHVSTQKPMSSEMLVEILAMGQDADKKN